MRLLGIGILLVCVPTIRSLNSTHSLRGRVSRSTTVDHGDNQQVWIDNVRDLRRNLSLEEIIAQSYTMQLFEGHLVFSRIIGAIQVEGQYTTMVVPWDTVLKAVDARLIEKLQNLNWRAHLQKLLRFHMMEGKWTPEDLEETQTFTMKNSERVI